MKLSSLRFSVGLGAVLALIVLGSVYAAFIPTGDEEADEVAPRDIIAETERHCVALAVYFEGGSTFESEEGQRHIARVVADRARANMNKWGGANLCDVVFYKRAGVCQFSFACLPLARRTPRPGPAWDASQEIARSQLEGRNDETPDLIRYYMNAPLSNPKSACTFRKEFVRVTSAGRHEFFREATSAERRELEQQNHHDCNRYTASLMKSKAKAKRFAKAHSKKKRYAGKAARRG